MKEQLKKAGMLLCSLLILLGASYLYLSRYAVVSNNVYGRELPIYSVDTEKKQVALTFDAAWGNEDTKKLLDILAKHNIHATFFLTGGWVNSYPEAVKAIYAAGHDIGNHSQNHKNMSQLSEKEKTAELMTVHKAVKDLTGQDMDLFRPPYGDYDDAVINNAKANHYFTIQWNIDSLDWKDYGKESILKTVLKNKDLQNGSIILLHNGAKYTAEALEELIVGLREQGYEFVPVSKLIYRDNYHMDVTGRQFSDTK